MIWAFPPFKHRHRVSETRRKRFVTHLRTLDNEFFHSFTVHAVHRAKRDNDDGKSDTRVVLMCCPLSLIHFKLLHEPQWCMTDTERNR